MTGAGAKQAGLGQFSTTGIGAKQPALGQLSFTGATQAGLTQAVAATVPIANVTAHQEKSFHRNSSFVLGRKTMVDCAENYMNGK
jgi:hypothetical protein